MNHAEFFPGRSQQPGCTICRGWLSPHGRQLVLPYSLVSVDQGQDRYSATPQLWRDAEGDCWLISYNQAQQEWIAENLGADLADAKKRAEKGFGEQWNQKPAPPGCAGEPHGVRGY